MVEMICGTVNNVFSLVTNILLNILFRVELSFIVIKLETLLIIIAGFGITLSISSSDRKLRSVFGSLENSKHGVNMNYNKTEIHTEKLY